MRQRFFAIPGVILVAVAAAMWGTDPIIRKPLSGSTSATTIVFGEHVFLVLFTLPLLVPALRAMWRAGTPYIAASIAEVAKGATDMSRNTSDAASRHVPVAARSRPRRARFCGTDVIAAATASHRSVVNVAMPHWRGR